MPTLVCDIETDGFNPSAIWVAVTKDTESGGVIQTYRLSLGFYTALLFLNPPILYLGRNYS